jgi:hypothetical protein
MPTYTFNYCYPINGNVDGKLRKKTLQIKGARLNIVLTPKFRNFLTNISQAGTFVPVKTGKSEHSSLTGSLGFSKICTVSLDTILFIERMNKI